MNRQGIVIGVLIGVLSSPVMAGKGQGKFFRFFDTNQDGVLRLAEMQGGSSARTPTQNHQTKLHGQMDRRLPAFPWPLRGHP